MQVYNTLTRQKEEFVPISGNKVGAYVCGPTVYDYSHLGHARCYVAFDVIIKYLRLKGYSVKYVQNLTDVDDKIIKRAKESGKAEKEISEKFAAEFFKDMSALGVARPDVSPKVTEHIPEIVETIKKIIENGYAYESGGDVYFDVQKVKGYGKLSNQSLENMLAGVRIDVKENKRYPLDFALWKKTAEGIMWDSPWGKGRPGWHIECSTMSMKYLGDQLDIHGGGLDLIFPHHENEILQSEAATGKRFSKYWMHNGFVTINKEKMSKSLGNFFTIRDILKKYSPETVRLFLLSTHYRSPIDFSDSQLEQAKKTRERLNESIERLEEKIKTTPHGEVPEGIGQIRKKFYDAMDDDFNTAEALSAVFELERFANTYLTQAPTHTGILEILKLFGEANKILGILSKIEKKELTEEAKKLIAEREQARKNKDFKSSDKIRDELKKMGVIVEDTEEGQKVKFA